MSIDNNNISNSNDSNNKTVNNLYLENNNLNLDIENILYYIQENNTKSVYEYIDLSKIFDKRKNYLETLEYITKENIFSNSNKNLVSFSDKCKFKFLSIMFVYLNKQIISIDVDKCIMLIDNIYKYLKSEQLLNYSNFKELMNLILLIIITNKIGMNISINSDKINTNNAKFNNYLNLLKEDYDSYVLSIKNNSDFNYNLTNLTDFINLLDNKYNNINLDKINIKEFKIDLSNINTKDINKDDVLEDIINITYNYNQFNYFDNIEEQKSLIHIKQNLIDFIKDYYNILNKITDSKNEKIIIDLNDKYTLTNIVNYYEIYNKIKNFKDFEFPDEFNNLIDSNFNFISNYIKDKVFEALNLNYVSIKDFNNNNEIKFNNINYNNIEDPEIDLINTNLKNFLFLKSYVIDYFNQMFVLLERIFSKLKNSLDINNGNYGSNILCIKVVEHEDEKYMLKDWEIFISNTLQVQKTLINQVGLIYQLFKSLYENNSLVSNINNLLKAIKYYNLNSIQIIYDNDISTSNNDNKIKLFKDYLMKVKDLFKSLNNKYDFIKKDISRVNDFEEIINNIDAANSNITNIKESEDKTNYKINLTYDQSSNSSNCISSNNNIKENNLIKDLIKQTYNELYSGYNEIYINNLIKENISTGNNSTIPIDESYLRETNLIDIYLELSAIEDSKNNEYSESVNKLKEVITQNTDTFGYMTSNTRVSISIIMLLKNIFNTIKLIIYNNNNTMDNTSIINMQNSINYKIKTIINLYNLYFQKETNIWNYNFSRKLILHNNLILIYNLINIVISCSNIDVDNSIYSDFKLNLLMYTKLIKDTASDYLSKIINKLILRISDQISLNSFSSFKKAELKSNYDQYYIFLDNCRELIVNFFAKFSKFCNEEDLLENINYSIYLMYDTITKYIINNDVLSIDDCNSLVKLIKEFTFNLKSGLINNLTFDNNEIKNRFNNEFEEILENNSKYKKSQEIIFILNSNLSQIKKMLITTNFNIQIDEYELIGLIQSLFKDTPVRKETIIFVKHAYNEKIK